MLRINDAANFRRTGAGISLIAGPLIALVGVLVCPELGSRTPDATLTAYAGNPVRAQVSAVLLWFGYLLFVPAALLAGYVATAGKP